ncbi:MAG: ABC transporter permease [Clostridia bacterium]
MKKGFVVFKYEFINLLKNKVFLAITLVLVVLISALLCAPRIAEAFAASSSGGADDTPGSSAVETERDLMALYVPSGCPENALKATLQAAFPEREVVLTQDDEQTLRAKVDSGELSSAVVLEDSLHFRYIVKTSGIYDVAQSQIGEALVAVYQSTALAQSGVDMAVAQQVLTASASGETVVTGTDQTSSFLYTFIMIFILYFAILMYGQLISSGVATEKTSRAMELLITSVKPTQLIFGKVVGIGTAALTQLVAIGAAVLVFYPLNRDYWADIPMIQSLFGVTPELVGYMILFFLLGFFLYAFLFAALTSLASKMEDVNTLVMPVILVFVAAFIVTMVSMQSGSVDNVVMKACSFIPFTSPMAMFTRITMGEVAGWEIALSVAILLVSNGLVCWLSAKIYKIGVLLYGSRPKMREVFQMLKHS